MVSQDNVDKADGGKFAGEWALTASILNCENALFGRAVLTDGGDMVYLAGGNDLVGRGVGQWAVRGDAMGFEIEVFQYVPNATVVDTITFRGVGRKPADGTTWMGDFYVCDFVEPPKHVGTFCSLRAAGKQLSTPPGSIPAVAGSDRQALLGRLDSMKSVPAMLEPKWDRHRLGTVPQVFYVPRFFEQRQADEFLEMTDAGCNWERMATRDTTEFGSANACSCGRGLLREPLPAWQTQIVQSLHTLGVFHPVLFPANSVRVNSYTPGQGIHPHLDGPVYYPLVAILSLGSPCLFDFWPAVGVDDTGGYSWDHDKEVPKSPEISTGMKPEMSVLLEPGSLIIFSHDAFTRCRHGIRALEEDVVHDRVSNADTLGLKVGAKVRRKRRLSLTIRHLLARCNCQGG